MSVQLASIVFSFVTPEQREQGYTLDRVFRGDRIYTSLDGPNLGFIDGIYFGEDPENQILGELDGWEFSFKLVQLHRQEFYKEHGLVGKSDREIQKYLDDNELSIPDVARLHFTTLNAGVKIRMTAQFKVPCNVSFLGYVR